MAKQSLFNRFVGWFKKRKKNRDTLSSTVKTAPSKPTRQTSEYKAPSSSGSSGSTRSTGGGGSYREDNTPKHAVGYIAPKSKVMDKAVKTAKKKAEQKKEKTVSSADVMKSQAERSKSISETKNASLINSIKTASKNREESDKGLTAREKALKHNVQKAVLNVGNRVGKDYAEDLKSGLYTSKATDKEKKNVAKSIEKDYNKKAKSKKAEAVAGFTKSDANIKVVTKGVTGEDIDVSKVTKSKAYKGGDVAQELASYAIAPTGAVEKGLAKAAVKALAKKTLKKEGKKVTAKAMESAAKKATKELAKQKGKNFARRRAADTIANAPLNAKYALDHTRDEKTGKVDKKAALKDFALNTGFDIGIGSAIDVGKAGKLLKATKRAELDMKTAEKIAARTKRLDDRYKKKIANKNKETVEKAKNDINATKKKAVKGRSAKSTKELNYGKAVDNYLKDIDDRVAKGKITKRQAKAERRSIARVVEETTGRRGISMRGENGATKYGRVTRKGIEEITDNTYGRALNLDKRIKGKNTKRIAKSVDATKTTSEFPEKIKAKIDDVADNSTEKVPEGKTVKEKTAPKKVSATAAKEANKFEDIEDAFTEMKREAKESKETTDRTLREWYAAEDAEKAYAGAGEDTGKHTGKMDDTKATESDATLSAVRNHGDGKMRTTHDDNLTDVAKQDREAYNSRKQKIADAEDKYIEDAQKETRGEIKETNSKQSSTKQQAFKNKKNSRKAQERKNKYKDIPANIKGTDNDFSSYVEEESVPANMKHIYSDFIQSTDKDIKQAAIDVSNGNMTQKKEYPIENLNRNEKRIRELTNVDTKDYLFSVEGERIGHIIDRHGVGGEQNETMRNVNDIARMGYILNNADEIVIATESKKGKTLQKFSKQYRNPDGTRAPLLHFRKKVNGDFVVVSAVQDSKAKKMRVESMWLDTTKKGSPRDPNGISTPLVTSKTPAERKPSGSNIAPEGKSVKGGDQDAMAHIAKPKKASGEAKGNSVFTDLRRKLENSMGFSERFADNWARDTGDQAFAGHFHGNVNNLRQAMQRASHSFTNEQIDYNGDKVGESAQSILKGIKGKGDAHYNDVQSYLYLAHHADRMDNAAKLGDKYDKRIFPDMSAEEARAKAQAILDRNPDVLDDANKILEYFRNDLRSQMQAGLISKDTFYHYIDTYPNYVPAHREPFSKMTFGGDGTRVNAKAFKAKGSDLDVLPIEDQMKMSAEYTFTRGAQNEVSKDIAKMSGYNPRVLDLYDDGDAMSAVDLATFYDIDKGTLSFWDEGKMVTIDNVDKQFLKDIQDAHISATQSEGLNAILNGMGAGNRVFKSLITSYNPAFVIKNFFRDVPEGAFQSQNMGLYMKNLGSGKALASILTNDDYFRAYKRMGGLHGQFINSAEEVFKDENWFKKNTIGRIEQLNELTEQMPRMAEFISFLEKRGKTPKTATADELRQAAEAAADVTVNFGRSGSIGRIINKSAVPFFNPAIQGFAKIGRVLTKDKSVSGYIKLISKGAMLGIAPAALNEWLLRDNENYQMINERDRAVNYYIPLDADNPLNVLFGSKKNGTKDGEVFLKIPKARFMSVLGMGAQNAMGTTKIPFADFVTISRDQIGPVGVSNNIFQQIVNSGITNNDSAGKTWYGADIENTRDQSKLPKDRYDENTSSVAIKLGELTGKSPKKIDYLIDSYTGVVGDVLIPKTRKASTRGFWAKNFSTDTVSQNNLTTKMYDRINELTQKKNSGDTSASTEYGSWYLNNRTNKASEIRDKIRSIQNSNKSKEQKAREVRPLQRQLNEINKNGLTTEGSFVKAAKKYVERMNKSSLSDSTKRKYGLENAMVATAKDRDEDPWKLVKEYTKQSKYRSAYAKYAKAAGLDPVTYKEYYNLKDWDLDGNGYAKKSEVISYLNGRDDLTAEQKAVLYAGHGGWLAKGANPYGSVGGSKVGSSGSGRRRYGKRRYSKRSSSKSSKTKDGKAVGATGTKVKSTVPKSTTKTTSVADVMKKNASTKATASAVAKILKSSSSADYEQAAKAAVKKKSNKNIYKITAKKV